jgi:hypothetical protein
MKKKQKKNNIFKKSSSSDDSEFFKLTKILIKSQKLYTKYKTFNHLDLLFKSKFNLNKV